MMTERITSRKNPLLQQVKKLLSSRKTREEAGLFVADGTKLLEEAVRFFPGLQTVILTDGVQANIPEGVREIRVPADVMESISPMASPQGALFICALPEKQAFVPKPGMLLLDGLQDPGNVGTIWRTADAFGADGIFLLPGCAEPWSPKTLRSTMGASFRLPLWEGSLEGLKALLDKEGIPLYATALREDTADIRDMDLSRAAVVIGSEGKGVSEAVLDASARTIKIPMTEKCESLNAASAGTVVLWQMSQGTFPR